ncbi:MAG: hybrid sensor histidine kinase/response regulator [Methanomicrobiales archaeon HGW-Methanomicrobiales-3]|jgi:DNA-binding response OmpR family regulator|nr:MAG: hybrid sensor histidine kinase/response regulator [Methanomicrobiales archaeon HGW-Methanomicrobiales-3]
MADTEKKPIRKILVVEDSRTQAEYLRHILENEGYRVTLAENGNEALEQIAIDRPSIIFTDIVMPELDGYDLCRRIKADEKTAKIPVILVTQLFDPADVIRGLEAGADDFIIKPFEAGYIRTRLATILSAMQHPDPDGDLPPLPVTAGGKTYTVTSSRLRIFNILLSTYEVAVSKNAELLEAQDRLGSVNEQLQQAVENLKLSNTRLTQENIERQRVQKALDEANTKLNLMASITRHDVINQLTSQHETLESALQLRDRDPKKAWEHVATAEEIATRTLNAIRFTGEYQKVGVKAPQWQNLRMLVDAAVKHTTPGTIVIANTLPQNQEIYADPLIEKVFANLIDNAIKYGQKLTSIRFTLETNGDAAIIVCEDDGVGIPEKKKELVFSYEYGMDSGLGLFLSREILAITGITLRETGTEGTGARFELRCPNGTLR